LCSRIPGKLTPPRLTRVIPRNRLFSELNGALEQGIAWIAAPPGAGKTALVTSYAETRGLRTIWYRVDEGDEDIADLFRYLDQAGSRLTSTSKPLLPTFAPEMGVELRVFSRRFFRELFSAFDGPCLLVFDDLHQVGENSLFHEALAEGLSELPRDVSVILASRNEPAPSWASLRAKDQFSVVDWQALRLTDDEVAAIARERVPGIGADAIAVLGSRCEGWVAGLILLLSRGGTMGDSGADRVGSDTPTLLFDYFAREIWRSIPPAEQIILVKSVLLPVITGAGLHRLSGDADAISIVEKLYRRNYFTLRLNEGEYQYHHLFRDFLRERLQEIAGMEQRAAWNLETAQYLEAEGLLDEAADCLVDAAEWPQLARLSCEQAQLLLVQGRHATLERWLRALPAALFEQQPWLPYWLGNARLSFNPQEAQQLFERAFTAFAAHAAEDNTPALMGWAGIMDSILYARNDYSSLLRWLDELERLLEPNPGFSSPMVEARVTAAMIYGLFHAHPDHPHYPRWLERGMQLLYEDIGAPNRVMLAAALVMHSWWYGEPQRGQQAVEAARSGIGDNLLPLALTCFLELAESLDLMQRADYPAARELLNRGVDRVSALGSEAFESEFLLHLCYGYLFTGDADAVDRPLQRLVALIPAHHHFNYGKVLYIEAWQALQRGEARKGLTHALDALHSGQAAHVYSQTPMMELMVVVAYQALGETGQARAYKERFDAYLELHPNVHLACCGLFHSAHAAFTDGSRERALSLLGRAMEMGRANGLTSYLGWLPDVMTLLCAEALRAGIEVDYVCHLIRSNGLLPDPHAQGLTQWPWPVELKLLGGFELNVNGKALRSVGKGQYRLMALLKVVAASDGQEAGQELLMDALWPDAEGDAARRTLDTSVYRLRKYLDMPKALVFSNGRLGLDPRYCRVDVQAFHDLAEGLEERLRQDAGGRSFQADVRSLMELYQGPLLPDDTESPWLNARREALRERFIRVTGLVGRALEEQGDTEAAIDCYRQALEREPAEENLHQMLIRGYLEQGRSAQARTAFQRCTQALMVRGLRPAVDTVALLGAAAD